MAEVAVAVAVAVAATVVDLEVMCMAWPPQSYNDRFPNYPETSCLRQRS